MNKNIKMTDTQLLDYLQSLNDKSEYTGKCILRKSVTGRGWRLHEHSGDGAVKSVRQAIIDFMYQDNKNDEAEKQEAL